MCVIVSFPDWLRGSKEAATANSSATKWFSQSLSALACMVLLLAALHRCPQCHHVCIEQVLLGHTNSNDVGGIRLHCPRELPCRCVNSMRPGRVGLLLVIGSGQQEPVLPAHSRTCCSLVNEDLRTCDVACRRSLEVRLCQVRSNVCSSVE